MNVIGDHTMVQCSTCQYLLPESICSYFQNRTHPITVCGLNKIDDPWRPHQCPCHVDIIKRCKNCSHYIARILPEQQPKCGWAKDTKPTLPLAYEHFNRDINNEKFAERCPCFKLNEALEKFYCNKGLWHMEAMEAKA